MRAHPMAGVDIVWKQDGKTFNPSYSTVGSDLPAASTGLEAVEALARRVAARL